MTGPEKTKKYKLDKGYYFLMMDQMTNPAYLLKNMTDFPILMANQAFYDMIGSSRQEMELKYGGRLAAVMEAAPYYKAVFTDREKNPFIHKNSGKDELRSYYTSLHFVDENEEYIFCISFDITDFVYAQNKLDHLSNITPYLAKQIKTEFFEWNLKSGDVQIYNQFTILDGLAERTKIGGLKDYLKEYFDDEKSADKLDAAFFSIAEGKKEFICELSKLSGVNKNIWSRFSLFGWSLKAGRADIVLGIFEDITREKEATFNYLRETQFYHVLLSEKDGYGHLDITNNQILYMGGIWNIYNELIHEVTYEQLICTFINKIVHPDDREGYLEIMLPSNLIASHKSGITRLGCDFRRILEQNKMVWMRLGIHLFCEPLNGHLLGLFYVYNIDAEKKQNLHLQYEAQRDQLTNTYNKKITETLIQEHFRQSGEDVVSALILIDLDDFRQVNDNYGHKTGDQVLVFLVTALGETFRKNDIIGRIQGDKFAILLKNIKSEELIAERLQVLFDKLWVKKDPEITCSAGIALVCGGCDYEEVFDQADAALHEAKCAGKARYHFYNGKSGVLELVEGEADGKRKESWTDAAFNVHDLLEEKGKSSSFDSFVGEQGDMAYLVDPDSYDLICGNQAFYDRIGLMQTECVGIKCYEAMHKRKSPCPFCGKANWSTDKFFFWKDMNSTLEQEFLIKNKLVSWMGREVLLALAVDISNDKSISEFIDSGTSESHILVSTIQRMEKCESLRETVLSAMDSIGHFFRADAVGFWEMKPQSRYYECSIRWHREGNTTNFGENENMAVTQWLRGRRWNGALVIDSPEDMLGYSFDMYQIMRSCGASNYQWVQLNDMGHEFGCICVVNGLANIRNDSFLESIAGFLVNEMKRKKVMEEVIYSETHDKLTDLLTRGSYEAFLQSYDPDSIASIGIVAANIDNLKGINETSGYLTGNYFIKRFSEILKEIFKEALIFRLNGDEFMMIAENIERQELEQEIFKLADILSNGEDYTVSVGYGWDNVEKDINDLIPSATSAMHVNKKKHYDAGLISSDAKRGKMLAELLGDIQRGDYEIYLQPKINMEKQQLIGAEALIRHLDSKRGTIPPAEFIPILEANNLIRYVDLFVMEQVCKLQERWRKERGTDLVISLNFSRITLLEENIVENIEDILSQFDISRSCIEIEITESFVAGGKSTLYRVAKDLYNAGCYLSLDDFGIRYTNISMLADIDFHTLKLDKSLIKALGKKESNQIIIKNIIRLCDDMGIHVIAEGVETKEQQEVLRRLGCTWGQGYLFGKPMTVKEFEQRYLDPKQDPIFS